MVKMCLSLVLTWIIAESHLHHEEALGPTEGLVDSGGERQQGGFSPGDRVRHPHFGRGRVIAANDRQKVRIRFEDGHTRLLHLDYAVLERVTLV